MCTAQRHVTSFQGPRRVGHQHSLPPHHERKVHGQPSRLPRGAQRSEDPVGSFMVPSGTVRAVRRRSEVRDRLGRVVDLDVGEPEATAAVTAVQPTKRLGLLRGPIAVLRQQRGRIRKCEHRAPRRCHSSTAAVQHRSWTRRPTRLGFSQREWSHRHLITLRPRGVVAALRHPFAAATTGSWVEA